MLTTTGDRRRTEHKTKYELELVWCFCRGNVRVVYASRFIIFGPRDNYYVDAYRHVWQWQPDDDNVHNKLIVSMCRQKQIRKVTTTTTISTGTHAINDIFHIGLNHIIEQNDEVKQKQKTKTKNTLESCERIEIDPWSHAEAMVWWYLCCPYFHKLFRFRCRQVRDTQDKREFTFNLHSSLQFFVVCCRRWHWRCGLFYFRFFRFSRHTVILRVVQLQNSALWTLNNMPVRT